MKKKNVFVISCTPEDGDKGSCGSLPVEADTLEEAIENNKSILKELLMKEGHRDKCIKHFSGFQPKNPKEYIVGKFNYYEGDPRL